MVRRAGGLCLVGGAIVEPSELSARLLNRLPLVLGAAAAVSSECLMEGFLL